MDSLGTVILARKCVQATNIDSLQELPTTTILSSPPQQAAGLPPKREDHLQAFSRHVCSLRHEQAAYSSPIPSLLFLVLIIFTVTRSTSTLAHKLPQVPSIKVSGEAKMRIAKDLAIGAVLGLAGIKMVEAIGKEEMEWSSKGMKK